MPVRDALVGVGKGEQGFFVEGAGGDLKGDGKAVRGKTARHAERRHAVVVEQSRKVRKRADFGEPG